MLIERIVDARHALAQVRASQIAEAGHHCASADAFDVTVTGRAGDEGFFALELPKGGDFWQLTDAPAPCPALYRTRSRQRRRIRYQTVSPANLAPLPRQPPACTSTKPCWPTLKAQGIEAGLADAACRRRHLPAGARDKHRRTPHAFGTLRDSAGDGGRHCRDALPVAARVIAVGTTSCVRSSPPRSPAN